MATKPEVGMPLHVHFQENNLCFIPSSINSSHVMIDLLKTPYLQNLHTVDELTIADYHQLVEDRDTLFKVDQSLDSDDTIRKKESLHRLYDP